MIFLSEAFRQREFVHTFHSINYAFFSINKVSHSNMNERLLQNAYEMRKKRDLKRDDIRMHIFLRATDEYPFRPKARICIARELA